MVLHGRERAGSLQLNAINQNAVYKAADGEVFYKSGLQLQELIAELLDFRKQEQGHMRIKVREQNIVDFLYENYLLFREYAVHQKVDFKFNKTSDAIQVWYDAKQLQKVVNNLLSNAFQYTPAGGEIALSVRKGNGEVIVEVSDNGCGIESKDLHRISPKKRLPPTRARTWRPWNSNRQGMRGWKRWLPKRKTVRNTRY